METVKPLTWEEAKNEVAKKKEGYRDYEHLKNNSGVHYLNAVLTKAAELYASSRVRALEEELTMTKDYYESKIETVIRIQHSLEEENKRLQERLEAAENKKPNLAYYQKTIVQFDLIRIDKDEFVVDPQTLYVFGFINYILLQNLLIDKNYLNEIGESFQCNVAHQVTLLVWEDCDDSDTWLDYKIIEDDLDVPTPAEVL